MDFVRRVALVFVWLALGCTSIAAKAQTYYGAPYCDLYDTGERRRSISLFKQAASAGLIGAQVNLGNIYDAGDGVRCDFPTARYWYKRAISQGSPEAAYNLAVSYLHRDQVRWARYWLLVAEKLGDEDAVGLLAELV